MNKERDCINPDRKDLSNNPSISKFHSDENITNPDRKNATTNEMEKISNEDIRERRPEETVKKVLVNVKTADGGTDTIEQDYFEEPFLLYEINQLEQNINSLGYYIKETNDPDDPKVKEYLNLCEVHIKQIEDWINHYEHTLNKDGKEIRKKLEGMKELLKKVQVFYI